MAYEEVWDETWERVDPGHYVNGRGFEIWKDDQGWKLNLGFLGDDDEKVYTTLKAAKNAADNI